MSRYTMAVHLKVVETFETPTRPPNENRMASEAQGALHLRLIRAFSKISDERARLRIVELAEEEADPIWDY
ncbi:MAG TPA: hypothetical protein VGC26_06075 [Afipia sp.]